MSELIDYLLREGSSLTAEENAAKHKAIAALFCKTGLKISPDDTIGPTRKGAANLLYLEGKSMTHQSDMNSWVPMLKNKNDRDYAKALIVAISALRGPKPDSETGFVLCGCGGKAKLIHWDETLSAGDYPDHDATVYCTECGMGGDVWFKKEEDAKTWWNTGHGWRQE